MTSAPAPQRKPTGHIIYAGPSLIDGSPIVAIALSKSRNTKTGNMVQTYILRSDMDPRDANRLGLDYAICGDCPSRGTAAPDKSTGLARNRACYVAIGQGPLNVFKAFRKGQYPAAQGHEALAALGACRMVRLGTYGDPAAVPSYIWQSLISNGQHTGYSHQRNVRSADFCADIFMRSADSKWQAEASWARGERTFRIVRHVSELVPRKEILCPASAEAGRRTTCQACKLCGGASIKAKSIAIVAHGAGACHTGA